MVAVIIIVTSIVVVSFAYFALGYYLSRLRRAKRKKSVAPRQGTMENEIANLDSLQFPLVTLETATKEFCDEYKLGQGGFGEVYKGVLPGGQEIAVKRQWNKFERGVEQFRTEVALVAKLQHRNLVRLLGFCLEGEVAILVYEFVPNKSLDFFLFDTEKRVLLDWSQRCKIIGGIARGILYLHEDSRLRVVHRDLKASNVLLDKEMNPKISDFGIAKMFGTDDPTEGRTRNIVGTYGYMAPEYAMGGLYSSKSDVFSYGVLLLEILSGKQNSGFYLTKLAPCLTSYAWQLWNEEKGLEFMDPALKSTCQSQTKEFLRYLHIGLLCVQEAAHIRPTMSFVVQALNSEDVFQIPIPERPPYSIGVFGDHELDESSTSGWTISR